METGQNSKRRSPQVFSEDTKRMICEHYLKGNYTKEEVRIEFGIKGNSSLLLWLRKFGYFDSNNEPIAEIQFMAKPQKENSKDLEKENQELKLQLEMYKRMISIAEKEFKISIVKKSDTK